MHKVLITLIILLSAFHSFSQRAKDGNFTVSDQKEIINTYTELTANVVASSTSITVGDNKMIGNFFLTPLKAGDLLLIYQVQGGAVDVWTYPTEVWGGSYVAQHSYFSNGNNSSYIEFGEVQDYKNTGIYEFVEVRSISGTQTITLNCPLTKSFFTGSNNKSQVIRVPRFEDLNVPNNSSISTPKWNGTIGGVVAIEVDGTLNISGNGTISADSTGFRGGLPVNTGTAAPGPGSISNIESRGYLGSYDPVEGSAKGEGIYGGITAYDLLYSRYGYGAIANGGGGGGYHNAGGGGGSNVGVGNYYGYGVVDQGPSNAYNAAWNLEGANLISTPSAGGGRGGYSHAEKKNDPLIVGPHNALWGMDNRRISGGVGGHPLTYDANRVFMGGGGGAGHGNNDYGGVGGDGGGVVFLNLYGDVTGNGTISANGEKGGDAVGPDPGLVGKSGDDGAGGAGGGGSVIIKNINPLPATISIEAKGGTGGDQDLKLGRFSNNYQADGPGGGGAGGLIAYSVGTPSESVIGGLAGETNSNFMVDFPVNGATGGAEGLSSQTTFTFDIAIENDTICEGEKTILTASIIGNLTPVPTLYWYNTAVGGSPINTGNTFTTPVLNSSKTYYIGTCPGTFRKPITVVVSPEIIITGIPPTTSPETCAGNDGSITGLSVTGGIGALSYEWNGASSPTIDLTNAIGGSYTLTVTDIAGCSKTVGPFTIAASPGPSIDVTNMSITDESCTGNDGSITGITVSGGATPYTYKWNGTGSATIDHTGVPGGTYTLIVTDNNNCSATVGPFTINSAPAVIIDISNMIIKNASCNVSNGEITGITASGGTGSLTYSWSPSSATTLDLTGVGGGSYTLTVTDGAGCKTTSGPHSISQLSGAVIDETNMIITNETCGDGNGGISGITVSGTSLSYLWSPSGATTLDVNSLSSGTHTLTITDGSGCIGTAGPYTINNTAGPVVDISGISLNDETCSGNDGSISGITFTGGTAPFTFDWSGTTTATTDLNNASGGTYNLTITDGNGCTSTAGPFVINGIIPIVIDESNMSILDESCNGNDGSITGISASGGTGTLTYNWSSGGTTLDLLAMNNGNYLLTVTDGMGCFKTSGPHTINLIPGPTVDDVNVVINDETCSLGNGSIIGITATGTGLTYAWSPSGVTSLNANDLSSGTHTLIITDVLGCSVSAGPYTINNALGPIIDLSGLNIKDENCLGNNGSITGITIAGGTLPYSLTWNAITASSPDLINIDSGTYNFVVTDANGCTANAGPFTITDPTLPTVSILTPNQMIAAGSSVPIQSTVTPVNSNIFWSPAEGLSCTNCEDPIATPEVSTWYLITVISADGCVDKDSIYIRVEAPCGKVGVPTVFSPNRDGLNDNLCVLGNCIESMHLEIYNRWGEKVFETNEVDGCWDGTYKGKPVSTGVYVYKLNGVGVNGEKLSSAGNINLLR